MCKRRVFLCGCVVLGLAAAGCGGNGAAFVSIGTGGVTGVYYPVGSLIARFINDDTEAEPLRASVEATGGSVFNINALLTGDLDFGIAQADRQYQALHGLEEWAERGPQEDLRTVCSLYTELVTLAAAEDAGIASLTDLRGKRVNIGNPGSGSRANAIHAMEAAGLDWQQELRAEQVTSAESAKMLQDERIDAYFFTVGHPAGSFMEATAGRRLVRFVPITGMEALIESAPYYTHGTIPMRYYPSAVNTEDVETIGVQTSLITSASVPEEVVYKVTRVIHENLEALRAQHDALGTLSAEDLAAEGPLPFHPGAERYYREVGLL